MLQFYNQIHGFTTWCQRHNFTLINEVNAKYYYILFQQDRKCATKSCLNCNGEFISYDNENGISDGRLYSKRCVTLSIERQRKVAENLKSTFKVPLKYEHITWDNITISPISKANLKAFAQRYPNNKPNGLYIYSKNTQTGKTTSLWVLIKELISQLKLTSVIIQSTPIILANAREDEFSNNGINYTVKSAMACDLLALDDFGIEKQTAWSSEKLYTILNERSNKNKPTFISSCLEPDPLLWQSPFEKSIIGKILESSICIDLDAKE